MQRVVPVRQAISSETQGLLVCLKASSPWVSEDGQAIVFMWRKPFQGYPTFRDETTRPPELSRPPRQLGDIHINDCLNFTTTRGNVKGNSGGGGEGFLGYPKPYKWGLDTEQFLENDLLSPVMKRTVVS